MILPQVCFAMSLTFLACPPLAIAFTTLLFCFLVPRWKTVSHYNGPVPRPLIQFLPLSCVRSSRRVFCNKIMPSSLPQSSLTVTCDSFVTWLLICRTVSLAVSTCYHLLCHLPCLPATICSVHLLPFVVSTSFVCPVDILVHVCFQVDKLFLVENRE